MDREICCKIAEYRKKSNPENVVSLATNKDGECFAVVGEDEYRENFLLEKGFSIERLEMAKAISGGWNFIYIPRNV